jgi:hypothetical protein
VAVIHVYEVAVYVFVGLCILGFLSGISQVR